MDYLPRGEAVVQRDPTNRVVKVIAVWQGYRIPFIITANHRVLRADYSNCARPVIPANHYQKMYRQVVSVFKQSQARARAEELAWLVQDLSQCGVTIKGSGRLEITRWDKAAGQKPKLIRQTVKDIDSAIRMQDHIISGYLIGDMENQSELDKLESIELVITLANQVLLDWRQTEAGEKEKLQKQLAGVVLKLEKCRNEFKVAAREQTEEIIPLKDSLGRPNPGAFAARTIAALNNLTQRIKELNVIVPYVAMRKELLVLADRWLKSKFKQAAGVITLIARHRVFTGGPITQYEPKIMARKIDQAVLLLNNEVISPHYQLARKVKIELKSAKKLFQEKSYEASRLKLSLALELLPAIA